MKNYFAIFTLLVIIFSSGKADCQAQSSEKKVIITYTWSRIDTHGSNQIAVWVEDTAGSFIRTISATRFTTSGGYIKRPVALSEWVVKSDLKSRSKDEIDAITGSTQPSGKQSLTWDCKDNAGNPLPFGKYVIRMEANIQDTDKMYFRGLITIGEGNQEIKGETYFSRPELASGNILFKDVSVEYK